MNTFLTCAVIGSVILAFPGCKPKVESSQNAALESKATALDNQAATVRKDSKVDAVDQAKQASLDADAEKTAANAHAEVEMKTAEQSAVKVRETGEQAAKALEERAKETRDMKSPAPVATATP